MPRTTTRSVTPSFRVDDAEYDRQIVGDVMLLVDREGHALAVRGEEGPRLATPNDLVDLLASGRARAVEAAPCRRGLPLRGMRRADPAVSKRIAAPRSVGSDAFARHAADEALTLGAFVHVSDAEIDALGGYEVYCRALAGIRRRHPRAPLAMAGPTAFRRRVEEVAAVLATSAQEAPTRH